MDRKTCSSAGRWVASPAREMHWPPPLEVRMPGSEDYTSLGQEAYMRVWLPALVGLGLFFSLLVLATLLGLV